MEVLWPRPPLFWGPVPKSMHAKPFGAISALPRGGRQPAPPPSPPERSELWDPKVKSFLGQAGEPITVIHACGNPKELLGRGSLRPGVRQPFQVGRGEHLERPWALPERPAPPLLAPSFGTFQNLEPRDRGFGGPSPPPLTWKTNPSWRFRCVP